MSLYILAGLLLLSYVENTTAMVASGGLGSQDPSHNITATTLEKRIGMAVIPTSVSVIYLTGDPRRARTADLGFDFQINYISGLWAPCPTTVREQDDCMVGSCYDGFLCSEGCGKTDGTLAAISCTRGRNTFCSTAFLTYQTNLPAASNYACASDVNEENYMAFTAELPLNALITSSSTSSVSTDSGANIAQDATQSGLPRSTGPPPSSSTSGPGAASDSADAGGNAPATNNIGVIIGGVAGCLALVCGCALASVWLLRRKRNAKAKAASASSSAPYEGDGASFDGKPELEAVGQVTHERAELFGQSRSEMSARGPAAYDTSTYRADNRPMTPVELPTNGQTGWV